MSDCYYELLDADDPVGERFAATDLVRSTWSASIQHGAPPSALLVPKVNGRLARGYTPADVEVIQERLRFSPMFVESAPAVRS